MSLREGKDVTNHSPVLTINVTLAHNIHELYCRLSREEKQFSRELHQAIAASIHDTDQPGSLQSSPADIKNEKGGVTIPVVFVSKIFMFCFTSAEDDSDFCLEDEGAGDESSSCSFSESGKDSDFEASPPPKKGKGAKSQQKKMTKKTTEKTVKQAVAKGLLYSLFL